MSLRVRLVGTQRHALPAVMLASVLQMVPVTVAAQEHVGSQAAGMAGAMTAVSSGGASALSNPAAVDWNAIYLESTIAGGRDVRGEGARFGGMAAVSVGPVALVIARSARDLGEREVAGGRARDVVTKTDAAVAANAHRGHLSFGVALHLTGRQLRSDVLEAEAPVLNGSDEIRPDVDAGLLYRRSRWGAGLAVRELAAPTMEAGDGRRLDLRPMVHAGASWTSRPRDPQRWVVAADVALTQPVVTPTRRDVALGGERWFGRDGRHAVRAGVRASTAGPPRTVAAGGVTVWVARRRWITGHLSLGQRERSVSIGMILVPHIEL